MLKHLVTLLLADVRPGVGIARDCPATAPRGERRYPDLQNGAFHRLDLWIPSAHGLPFRTKWFISARSVCWRDGHNWYRYRDHGRRGHGMGRICTHGRPEARSALRHLCGCKRRGWRWGWRRCQPAVRRNGAFDRLAAAVPRGVGRYQFVSWSFEPYAFLGTMKV